MSETKRRFTGKGGGCDGGVTERGVEDACGSEEPGKLVDF